MYSKITKPIYAVKNGFYRNDPTFPPRPSITLTEPIPNFGPDADSFRNSADRQIKDASSLGRSLRRISF